MHLAARTEIPERPSAFDMTCRILRDVIRLDAKVNYLWTDGRWQPATLDEIMRRANRRRKSLGHPQFTGKKEWIA